eukprot:11549097-Ditylum_brightwellii.AAC.1
MHPGKSGYQGMIVDSTYDLTLDCLCEAIFSGLWGHEDDQDPSSVKIRTGLILTLGGTPILWISKLQTEIACSTMEVEYIAVAHSMQKLLPAQWVM